ncbi:hypothetical protein A2U01_0069027 [Trifolium medium]|uniref:Uncharacterized protein n=1 Tax=Trifolium medium TaxID=97028 RepID=A0A392SIK5_9FABA|nr:hypothetical protein [Trifolium medium]
MMTGEDPRRQGGRQTSRWLREETSDGAAVMGGGAAVMGGAREEPANGVPQNP